MATFMDVSLFQHFSVVFVFLLVFVIFYGFLSATKLFKNISGAKGLYAIISLAVAFLFAMAKDAYNVLMTMTPWFVVLAVFTFLIFFVLRMWSGDDDKLFSSLIKQPTLYWILIIIFVLIIIVSLSSTFGQSMLDKNPEIKTLSNGDQVVSLDDGTVMSLQEAENQGFDVNGATMNTVVSSDISTNTQNSQSSSTATDDFSGNVMATIIHPKVLGLILFMFISFLTIIFLAKSGNPE